MSSFKAHFGDCHIQKPHSDPHVMSHSTVMQDCFFVAWLSDSSAGIQQTSNINLV